MYANIKSNPVIGKSIKDVFNTILSVPINDGVQIVFIKIKEVKTEGE